MAKVTDRLAQPFAEGLNRIQEFAQRMRMFGSEILDTYDNQRHLQKSILEHEAEQARPAEVELQIIRYMMTVPLLSQDDIRIQVRTLYEVDRDGVEGREQKMKRARRIQMLAARLPEGKTLDDIIIVPGYLAVTNHYLHMLKRSELDEE